MKEILEFISASNGKAIVFGESSSPFKSGRLERMRALSALCSLSEEARCSGTSKMDVKLFDSRFWVLSRRIRGFPVYFAVGGEQAGDTGMSTGMWLMLSHIEYFASTLFGHQYEILLQRLDEQSVREQSSTTFGDTVGRTPMVTELIGEDLFDGRFVDGDERSDQGVDCLDYSYVYDDLAGFERQFIHRLL